MYIYGTQNVIDSPNRGLLLLLLLLLCDHQFLKLPPSVLTSRSSRQMRMRMAAQALPWCQAG